MGLPRSQPQPLITAAEYLRLERAAEERHEYLNGRILAMAGESDRHGIISVNLVVSLGGQLRGTSCQVRTKDTKVRSGPVLQAGASVKGLFSYPDVLVVCGEPQYHDTLRDVILNPKVLVEVLSPSTEAFDRGGKFHHYQMWNPTLADYLLVAQDEPLIDHFTRRDDGSWLYRSLGGLEVEIALDSIGCVLRSSEVYERVDFTSSADQPMDEATE